MVGTDEMGLSAVTQLNNATRLRRRIHANLFDAHLPIARRALSRFTVWSWKVLWVWGQNFLGQFRDFAEYEGNLLFFSVPIVYQPFQCFSSFRENFPTNRIFIGSCHLTKPDIQLYEYTNGDIVR